MSLITQEIRASASEIYHGDAICQEKSKFLLTEMELPNGLLPLEDIVECGYVKETGFVWLIQKKEKKHKFEKIGKLTSYATEVTAIVEKFKIKKLTGVKTKELLMWITLSEITVDDPSTGKITFKATSGLYRSFPVSAFQIEDVKEDVPAIDVAKDPKLVHEVNKDNVAEVTEQRSMANQSDQDGKLGGVARKAKERLDGRFRSHWISEINSQERSRDGGLVEEIGRKPSTSSMVVGDLQMEVFGLKKSESKRFNWGKIRLNRKSSEQDECDVCLERFKVGEKLDRLPCAHQFHSMCLLPWLESYPCCRMSVLVSN